MTELASLVVFSGDVAATVGFYRALGVPLADESHDDGPAHAAADVGGVHVAVYPGERRGRAPGRRESGSSFAGFYVPDLDAATTRLRDLGARVLGQHEPMPWGCRVVVEDPDGRAVEVNQRGHCPAEATPG